MVNSRMIRELQRLGVQIEEFSVNAFRNEQAEVAIWSTPIYTSHLSWTLKFPPQDDESYQDLIKYVRIYRNDKFLGTTRTNRYFDEFAELKDQNTIEYKLEVVSVTLDILKTVSYGVYV